MGLTSLPHPCGSLLSSLNKADLESRLAAGDALIAELTAAQERAAMAEVRMADAEHRLAMVEHRALEASLLLSFYHRPRQGSAKSGSACKRTYMYR